jgi:ABC-type lipoprotein release transport system permease subunit
MGHLLLLLKIARRNLLRNRRRTGLAAVAIGVGLAALMFTDALVVGLKENMVRAATDTFLGHAQVHVAGFRRALDVELVIRNRKEVLAAVEAERGVAAYASRVCSFAMVSTPTDSSAVLLYGIDARREPPISKMDEAIVRGAYLQSDDERRILIGETLARTLGVDVGERVVLTAAQAGSGDLNQDMARVAGVYRFGVADLDGAVVFAPLRVAQRLMGIGDEVHEIALQFRDLGDATARLSALRARRDGDGNEYLLWRDLVPELGAALDMSDYSTAIVGAILFAVAALITMNTLFMSLYERMFEFGVLRALGTGPAKMGALVLLESAALAVVSIVIGVAVGFAATWTVSHTGINYVGIEYAGVTLRDPVRPFVRLHQFTVLPASVFLLTVLAAAYPALYAARLTPARAMRRTL